jgi:hypothetical protein
VSYAADGAVRILTDDALDRRTVAEIQKKVMKQSERNAVSRLLHAKNDKETIASWKLELNRILQVFNVRSVVLTRNRCQLFPFRPSWP